MQNKSVKWTYNAHLSTSTWTKNWGWGECRIPKEMISWLNLVPVFSSINHHGLLNLEECDQKERCLENYMYFGIC